MVITGVSSSEVLRVLICFTNAIIIAIALLDPCSTGSYSTTGYEQCELCALGFYQNATNANTCERCPDSSQSTSNPGAAPQRTNA